MVFELKGSLFTKENVKQLKLLFSAALNKRGYLKFDLAGVKDKLDDVSISLDEAEIAYEYFIKDSGRFPLTNRAIVCSENSISDLAACTPILTPKDAVNLMFAPFEIWLENGRADRAFLLCVIDKKLREEIIERESEVSLKVDGKGGIGELKMCIKENKRPLVERNKLFVLMDSDCRKPNEPDAAAVALKSVCESKKIPYHCLERRMVENYLPTDYLERELPKNPEYTKLLKPIKVFNKLSIEQRACFHLKEGFAKKPHNEELYADISQSDRKVLNAGLGKKLIDFYSSDSWYASIGNEIRNNESPIEAKEILKKIKQVIRVPA